MGEVHEYNPNQICIQKKLNITRIMKSSEQSLQTVKVHSKKMLKKYQNNEETKRLQRCQTNNLHIGLGVFTARVNESKIKKM